MKGYRTCPVTSGMSPESRSALWTKGFWAETRLRLCGVDGRAFLLGWKEYKKPWVSHSPGLEEMVNGTYYSLGTLCLGDKGPATYLKTLFGQSGNQMELHLGGQGQG